MPKRCWIIDLESFCVEGENEDEAIKEAWLYIKELGVKIDLILPCREWEE